MTNQSFLSRIQLTCHKFTNRHSFAPPIYIHIYTHMIFPIHFPISTRQEGQTKGVHQKKKKKKKHTTMAAKNTMYVAFFVAVVVLAAIAVPGEARWCMDQCMPVCMKVRSATLQACTIACEGYCDQVEGSSGGCHAWACRR